MSSRRCQNRLPPRRRFARMTDALYALLAHAWSGMLLAAVVLLSGMALLGASRASRRPRLRQVGWGICLLALVPACGSLVSIKREQAAIRNFPPPGRLIDVGGFRMHLLAEGDSHGRPTLVWIPGGHAPGLAFYGHHREFKGE